MTERRLVWTWAVRVWRGSLGQLGWILLLSVVSAVLLALLPWLWQYVIDQVRTSPDPVRIRELALWMAAVGVGHAVAYLALQCLRAVMNCRIEWRARTLVFDHLADVDPAFYRRWRTGDLVTRLYDSPEGRRAIAADVRTFAGGGDTHFVEPVPREASPCP